MNVGIIPARLGSTRFPRKVLADLDGKPMVVRVAEQAQRARHLDRVLVAVDDEEVQRAVESFGLEAVLTPVELSSGTDRVAWVADKLAPEMVVNIQGDEPRMDPDIIDGIVTEGRRHPEALITAVSTDLQPADFLNPHVVKARLNLDGTAITFLREIPLENPVGYYRHLGIYGYSGDLLHRFTALQPSAHEQAYRLEQWRALDHGIPIRCIVTNTPYRGVDTPEDIEALGSFHDSDQTG